MSTAPPSSRGYVIALVGRPNVGKSTLFNRLIGMRKAVVSTTPGTTRDRLYGQTEWRGAPLTLIDTGGVDFTAGTGAAGAVQRHIRRALEEADGFLFVCDAQEGVVPADERLMACLRKTGKPVVLSVNKIDYPPTSRAAKGHPRARHGPDTADRGRGWAPHLLLPPEFFCLGAAQVFPVSALHGLGIGELLDHLVEQSVRLQRCQSDPPKRADLPAAQASDSLGAGQTGAASSCPICSVAIVGRQNVGKSSLLNALLREERAIVSDMPGTTRDAVDAHLAVNGERICLIDTAGLRHRRKVTNPVDTFSMSRALNAIAGCDVALVVLDATQGLTRDDKRIVTRVCQAGRGLVLLGNKWDLVKGGTERKLTDAVRRALPFASFAPVLAISAKTGFQVPRSLATTLRIARAMREGFSEVDCFALLQRAWGAHAPPRLRGRAIRLQKARWLRGRPVRVELTTSPLGRLPLPYQHYLLKRLYAHPGLSGIPIRLVGTPVAANSA